MQLSQDDICEFQQLWLEEFGEVITPERARYEAMLLIELYAVILVRGESTKGTVLAAEQEPDDA